MFKQKGYIYILSNPSFKGLFKVGRTSRDPELRAYELSSETGVPTPFQVIFYKKIDDYCKNEYLIHAILEKKGYRIAENKEFFNAPLNEIKKVISSFERSLTEIRADKFRDQIMDIFQPCINNVCWSERVSKWKLLQGGNNEAET